MGWGEERTITARDLSHEERCVLRMALGVLVRELEADIGELTPTAKRTQRLRDADVARELELALADHRLSLES